MAHNWLEAFYVINRIRILIILVPIESSPQDDAKVINRWSHIDDAEGVQSIVIHFLNGSLANGLGSRISTAYF